MLAYQEIISFTFGTDVSKADDPARRPGAHVPSIHSDIATQVAFPFCQRLPSTSEAGRVDVERRSRIGREEQTFAACFLGANISDSIAKCKGSEMAMAKGSKA